MFADLLSLFKKKKLSPKDINVTILEVKNNQVEQLLAKMFTNEIQGFIVKGFLSNPEVERARAFHASYCKSLDEGEKQTDTFPLTFFSLEKQLRAGVEVGQLQSLNEEVAAKIANPEISWLYTRLEEFFDAFSRPLQKRMFQVKDVFSVPLASFRSIGEGYKGITPHCEKYFQSFFTASAQELAKQCELDKHYSFFLQLQKPETGGELRLYDIHWSQLNGKKDFLSREEALSNGKEISFNQIKSATVSLDEGDLLVFNGGDVWHSVDLVKGNKHRITFGGFINPSIDNEALVVWT